MPATVPYGFRFPAAANSPDVPADLRNLAEDVNDEVGRVDGDVTAFEARLAALEALPSPAAWVGIDSGTGSGSTFLISGIPTSTYARVRLTLFGSVATAGNIRLRVNGDTTSGLHHWSIVGLDAAGNTSPPDITGFNDSDTFWQVAHWGTATTNQAIIELFPTDTTENISFMSWGMRVGGTDTTSVESRAWGRVNNPRLLDSIRVSGPPATNFAGTVRWWLEGLVAP